MQILVPTSFPPSRISWLRGLDSNQDNQIQSLVAYRLADPGVAIYRL